MASKIVRTTLALPADLLEAADQTVRRGGARSRNELVAAALRRELETRQRETIDAAIGDMAQDAEYLRELGQLMDEFATADGETLAPEGREP
ncbi:MAG TPA: ribbon-helix-helix domain-containing protein [Chloroflexota bacterium]